MYFRTAVIATLPIRVFEQNYAIVLVLTQVANKRLLVRLNSLGEMWSP